MSKKTHMSLYPGLIVSLSCHILFFYLAMGTSASPNMFKVAQVYSVTIEAGKKLGGVAQDELEKKSKLAPHKKVKQEPEPEVKEKPQKKEEKEILPDPEDAEVSLAETKATPTATPKPKARPKPKPKPKPKPTAIPKPKVKKTTAKKVVPKIKPKPKPKAKPKKLTASEIDNRLQKAIQRYKGASTNAGGQGFGAGRLGGSGFGGGMLVDPQVRRYMNLLERHIKKEWRWYDKKSLLKAQIEFELSFDGFISAARLRSSSGVRAFDDSAMRAVQKANPAPTPPKRFYDQYFRRITITFEPE